MDQNTLLMIAAAGVVVGYLFLRSRGQTAEPKPSSIPSPADSPKAVAAAPASVGAVATSPHVHLGDLAKRVIAEEEAWEKRRADTYGSLAKVLDAVEDFRGMLPPVSPPPAKAEPKPEVK